jgi:hypothetical protein
LIEVGGKLEGGEIDSVTSHASEAFFGVEGAVFVEVWGVGDFGAYFDGAASYSNVLFVGGGIGFI